MWERHVVRHGDGEPDLLYIDLHLIHEVTSPQAFDGLRLAGRPVRRPDLTVATMDHNVPTADIHLPVADPISAKQMEVLAANCAEFGIRLYPMGAPGQGIVHVIGPELGLTQPGMTIVCGDSHTSTHGAFGALAFGIGTSEVEHVLATQTLPQARPGTMAVTVDGELPAGVTAKDIVLAIINRIGTGGGIGSIIEYRGSAIRALSMEGRMTVCNMSIEAGARAGLVAPDDPTFAYLEGRRVRADGRGVGAGARRLALVGHRRRRRLRQGGGARRRRRCEPSVTWGTNPAQSVFIDDVVPEPRLLRRSRRPRQRQAGARLHGAHGGHADPRDRRRHRVHRLVHQLAHRGSPRRRRDRRRAQGARRRAHAGRAGLDAGEGRGRGRGTPRGVPRRRIRLARGRVLDVPGDEPRQARPSGERCASTSNRNFEGRQGKGGRTHLVSPEVAVATAIAGHFATPDDLD